MSPSALARALWGTSLLVAPRAVIRPVSGKPTTSGPIAATGRVLGARHLAQSLVVGRKETRARLLMGVAVDAAHALSMAGLAALSRDHRRLASLDAVLASGLAAEGLWRVRRVR